MKKLTYNQGFWVVGITYFVTMAFSTVPSPLYVLYQQHEGFSSLMITLVFAVYALATMASLYFFGHLSDWFGRRTVLVAGLCLELLSALVFLSGQSLDVLITARILCGLAMGLIAGTATAYLLELHAAARPTASRARSDLVASIAVMGGLGSGALVAGGLATWLTQPLKTPYVVFLILMAILTVCLLQLPETTLPKQPHPAYRPQRVAIPHGKRAAFFAAAGAALSLYAMLALFSSVAPIFMAKTLSLHSYALAGLVAFLVYAAGAAAQIALRSSPVGTLVRIGLRAMLAGMLLLVTGVWLKHFALFLAAGCIIGAGTGALFKGCISTVTQLAPPEARSETVAALFLTGYVGLSIPVVILGFATQFLSLQTALLLFTAVFLAVLLLVRRRLLALVSDNT